MPFLLSMTRSCAVFLTLCVWPHLLLNGCLENHLSSSLLAFLPDLSKTFSSLPGSAESVTGTVSLVLGFLTWRTLLLAAVTLSFAIVPQFLLFHGRALSRQPATSYGIIVMGHGAPIPLDFTSPLETHLNMDTVERWRASWPDYPDREIFSHLLLGGVAFRKLEPDRPRRTTDGGAPRRGLHGSPFLVDNDSVKVLPLNVLSRFPREDLMRGTCEIFTSAWQARLQQCPGSPPRFYFASSAPLPHIGLASHPLLPVLLLFSSPGTSPTSLARLLRAAGLLVVLLKSISLSAVLNMICHPVLFLIVMPLPSGTLLPAPSSDLFPTPRARLLVRPNGDDIFRIITSLQTRRASASSLFMLVELPGLSKTLLRALTRLPKLIGLPSVPGVIEATFAACAFGAQIQKYTTFWGSSSTLPLLARFQGRSCPHTATTVILPKRMATMKLDLLDLFVQSFSASLTLPTQIASPRSSGRADEDSSFSVGPASSSRPTVAARPAASSLRNSSRVDLDITRHGSTPLLYNPFKLGDSGKREQLRSLAVATYTEWLNHRTLRACDMPTSLPVAERLATATGDDVIREIERLLHRYGPGSSFHLVCGRSCQGRLCHGHELALLFEHLAESTSPAPFPRELKPTIPEIMADLAILMHLSSITGIPVFQIVSDVKDFFNQHFLAPEERYKVGLVTLDPRARTAHLLVFIWYVEMELAAASLVSALRQKHPAICHWQDYRARRLQPPMASMYTDDGHQALLGADLTILGLRVWRKVTGDLRLTMAIVQKHGLGQQVTVQGFRFNSGLGHSIRDPESPVLLSPQIRQQLREWRSRLVSNAGAPFTAAVHHLTSSRCLPDPDSAPAVFFLRSDASKEGARLPGLGGALGGRLVRYPWGASLSAEEMLLPIAVLEFAAYFMIVDSCVASLPGEALLVSEVDALSSADALAADAASSPLMQHVHLRFLALPAFSSIVRRHSVAHVYGEGNVMADAVSRGKYDVAESLGQQQLGLAITYEPPGPRLCSLMNELVALHHTSSQTQKGVHNNNMTGPPLVAHQAPGLSSTLLDKLVSPRHTFAQTQRRSYNNNMTGSPFAHSDYVASLLDTTDLERSPGRLRLRSPSPQPPATLPLLALDVVPSRYVLPSSHLTISLCIASPLAEASSTPLADDYARPQLASAAGDPTAAHTVFLMIPPLPFAPSPSR
ncbi:MAG: hypothetical protein SGPRY_003084 [Prymnesium sp.]